MIFGPKIKSLTDQELVLRYQKTGKKAFVGELFERYSHLVFGLCLNYLKSEAESHDAVINIFEKLMTDLHKHEVKSFKSWLYMVSRNHCLMFLRERQSARKREDRYRAEVGQEEPEQGLEQAQQREINIGHLEAALQELKEEQRICVELFYLQEKCYQEITEITGFTLKQVKSYIQNGKRNLRLKMSNHETIQIS